MISYVIQAVETFTNESPICESISEILTTYNNFFILVSVALSLTTDASCLLKINTPAKEASENPTAISFWWRNTTENRVESRLSQNAMIVTFRVQVTNH